MAACPRGGRHRGHPPTLGKPAILPSSKTVRPLRRHRQRDVRPSKSGFTLVELLVVIAVVATLAGLLLPALARARERALGAGCLNHLRQLQIVFHLYADDHSGLLSPSETWMSDPEGARWVEGVMSPLSTARISDLTNRQMLLASGPGRLGPYLATAEIFHCPADRSRTNLLTQRGPLRVRSYTMNQYIVRGDWLAMTPDGSFVYSPTAFVKWEDFHRASPAQIWVFIDEHELTIKNGMFQFQWPMGPNWLWPGHWPARRHGGRGALSFADGHAELPKWRDSRTGPRARTMAEAEAVGWNAANNPDYAWLWERTNGGVPLP
ncbi:MAG: prepilin-type N-terminal cleavage/methylation domain-containing protein [Verrucomicrobiae bacterium]|nr:prepilin-type N-terminal cleavage/methylation domain-containing protein [Verrucomicrobiae bacterium]